MVTSSGISPDSGTLTIQESVSNPLLSHALIPQGILAGDGNIPPGDPQETQNAKPFVAIVDDDVVIRNLYNVALKTLGFDIVGVFCDGKDIVDKIDALPVKPEVVVMDERMPNMSGLEACAIILGKYPGIRVIFLTADEEVKEKAIRAGAKGFLHKPISIKKLAEIIGSV